MNDTVTHGSDMMDEDLQLINYKTTMESLSQVMFRMGRKTLNTETFILIKFFRCKENQFTNSITNNFLILKL